MTANTGYELNTGVLFDFPPPELKGRFALAIDSNFFGRTQSVLRSGGPGGPIPGVAVHDNAHDRESKPGNFPSPSGAMPIDAPKVGVNPADDDAFLHFPPGPPPTVGPNRVQVGAR